MLPGDGSYTLHYYAAVAAPFVLIVERDLEKEKGEQSGFAGWTKVMVFWIES